MAIVGARPCELRALGVLDRVLTGGSFVDDRYAARRDGVFVVAVECGAPASTCFCTSMGTGPVGSRRLRPRPHRSCSTGSTDSSCGSDLRLEPRSSPRCPMTPADRGGRSRAVTPSSHGARRPASAASIEREGLPELLDAEPRAPAVGRGGRALPVLRELHARLPDLLLQRRQGRDRPGRLRRAPASMGLVLRRRALRPCMADRSARPPRSRYRQWLTHKLSTWWDQFGELGLRGLRPLHRLVPRRHRPHRGGCGHPGRWRRTASYGAEAMSGRSLAELLARPFVARRLPDGAAEALAAVRSPGGRSRQGRCW